MSKSRRKFKYDPIEGLMNEIVKLTSPPEPDLPTSSRREQAEARRHELEAWKNVESQICSYCMTGGNILCCDVCPASFHLICLGIDENEVPEGQWICNRCSNTPASLRYQNMPSTSTCTLPPAPSVRAERERNRNEEAFKYHISRELQNSSKLHLKNAMSYTLNALRKINPVEFTLDTEIMREYVALPFDITEKSRPNITGEICYYCNMRNEYSPMLKCDFCPYYWHMDCVTTPLIVRPTWRLWMCPAHVENLLDDFCEGIILAGSKRLELWNYFKDVDLNSKNMLRLWKRSMNLAQQIRYSKILRKAMRKRRQQHDWDADTDKLNQQLTLESENPLPLSLKSTLSDFYAIESVVNTYLQVKLSNVYRKNSRGRRPKMKTREMFFHEAYEPKYVEFVQSIEPKKEKIKCDPELDRLDKMRSIPFTDKDLYESIAGPIPGRWGEYLSSCLPKEAIENMEAISKASRTAVSRNILLAESCSEQEIINRHWKSLNIRSNVRGDSIDWYQPRSKTKDDKGRKKIVTELDLQLMAHGYGNEQHTRMFSSLETEAFYMRCAPPRSAEFFPSPNSLREILLHSQRASAEGSGCYYLHREAELHKTVAIMYDFYFATRKEVNSFWTSSMAIWSREPFLDLLHQRQQCVELETCGEDDEMIVKNIVGKLVNQVCRRMKSMVTPTVEKQKPGRKKKLKIDEMSDGVRRILAEAVAHQEEVEKKAQEVDVKSESNADNIKQEVKEEIDDDYPTSNHSTCNGFSVSATTSGPLTLDCSLNNSRESDCAFENGFDTPDIKSCMMKGPNSIDSVIDDVVRTSKDLNMTQSEPLEFSVPSTSTVTDGSKENRGTNGTNGYSTYANVERFINDYSDLYSMEALMLRDHDYVQPPMNGKTKEELCLREFLANIVKSENTTTDDTTRLRSVHQVRKRGRPPGSKNKEIGNRKKNTLMRAKSPIGETPVKKKRGRPRGSFKKLGRVNGIKITNSTSDYDDIESTTSCMNSPIKECQVGVSSAPIINDEKVEELRAEAQKLRQKYASMMVRKMAEDEHARWFKTRDALIHEWTDQKWSDLHHYVLERRMEQMMPFEARYFLPNVPIEGIVEVKRPELKARQPFAIQRALTKIGTANDCHIQPQYFTESFCPVIQDYHCDIIYDKITKKFILSTLAYSMVIVDDVVVQRKKLLPNEEALRTRLLGKPMDKPKIVCQCEKGNNNQTRIADGIIELKQNARIQIGCVEFELTLPP